MSLAQKRISSRLSLTAVAAAAALIVAPLALPTGTPLLGAATADAGHWRHHHHHGIDPGAAAVIGGIIGLGLGLSIGDPHYDYGPRYHYGPRPLYRVNPRRVRNAPRPYTRAWYRYCHAKYRSFDARSGTYQPYRGHRRLCR